MSHQNTIQISQYIFVMSSHCSAIFVWGLFFFNILRCIWDFMHTLILIRISFLSSHQSDSTVKISLSPENLICCSSFVRFCINLGGANDLLYVHLKPFCLCCASLAVLFHSLAFNRKGGCQLTFSLVSFFSCLLKSKCHFLWTIFVHMNITEVQLKTKNWFISSPKSQCFPWRAL